MGAMVAPDLPDPLGRLVLMGAMALMGNKGHKARPAEMGLMDRRGQKVSTATLDLRGRRVRLVRKALQDVTA